MKKILLTILAVLAMSGMAMAQTAPSDINLHRNEDGSWSFIMPGRNLVMSTETFSTNDTVNGHYLAGVPEGWLILALGDTVPVSNDSLRRTTPITEGAPVTIVPTGNLRRIKSITLVDEAPAKPALSLTSPSVGQVIGSDGKNYAAASVPSGVTKVAMIAYVSGSNGLAIALADEGEMNWETAKSTCEAKTPAFTNGTWKLPTQAEWNQMFSANGGNEESYTGLNTKINTAGGTALLEEGTGYWSSTPNGSKAWYVYLIDGETDWRSNVVNYAKQVRVCLAF